MSKKPTKQANLSIRERKLIKNIAAGMTALDAMKDAGYAESTARKKAKQVVGQSRIQESIQAIMERKGLTDERLTEVLERGLESTKVISAMIIRGKPDSIADEKDGMKDANSMTKDFVEVPDYATQHKYLDTGLKLKGHLRDKLDVDLSGEIVIKVKGRK